MIKIYSFLIVTVVAWSVLLISPPVAQAVGDGGFCYANSDCGEDYYCAPGYTATWFCSGASPPEPGTCRANCTGDGGSVVCPCGTNASGGCKSCSGAYSYPECGSGTVLTIFNNPASYECFFKISCGNIFPTAFNITGCNNNDTKGACSHAALCCSPDSTITCGALSTYVREGSTCPAGEMKWGSTTQIIWGDDGENLGTQQYVTCRRNCNCTPACNTTSPSAISFNDNRLTWTQGSNGTSQNLYVSRTASDVNTACGTGTNCIVNANLANSVNSYSFTSPLQSNTTYYVRVMNFKNNTCSSNAYYSFLTPFNDPWWQVGDSDVASNGVLQSYVPGGKFFGLPGLGGYPGVTAYKDSTNITSARVSQTGWIAQSPITNPRVFNYRYFENQIPSDTAIYTLPSNEFDQNAVDANTVESYGYFWYKFDGTGTGLDLNINSALDIGTKKVILLVDSADFLINAPVNLTDGQGFFMAVVGSNTDGTEGNVSVAPSVGGSPYDLEGIYIADGTFSTGEAAVQLRVRGSVVSYAGFNLARDLGEGANVDPSEYFEYAPDQILLFPSKLGTRKINWKEVAP
jgi:hypothetical protein